jgi:hypothetical protein
MIEFKVSNSELNELKETVPNLTLILNALNNHSEITLVLGGEPSTNLSVGEKTKPISAY